eukprot:873632-Rhodomonas_salina.1
MASGSGTKRLIEIECLPRAGEVTFRRAPLRRRRADADRAIASGLLVELISSFWMLMRRSQVLPSFSLECWDVRLRRNRMSPFSIAVLKGAVSLT